MMSGMIPTPGQLQLVELPWSTYEQRLPPMQEELQAALLTPRRDAGPTPPQTA